MNYFTPSVSSIPAPNFFGIDPTSFLFIGLGILVLLFILAREFFCWYCKINKIVDLLESIKENTALRDMETLHRPSPVSNQQPRQPI